MNDGKKKSRATKKLKNDAESEDASGRIKVGFLSAFEILTRKPDGDPGPEGLVGLWERGGWDQTRTPKGRDPSISPAHRPVTSRPPLAVIPVGQSQAKKKPFHSFIHWVHCHTATLCW